MARDNQTDSGAPTAIDDLVDDSWRAVDEMVNLGGLAWEYHVDGVEIRVVPGDEWRGTVIKTHSESEGSSTVNHYYHKPSEYALAVETDYQPDAESPRIRLSEYDGEPPKTRRNA